MRNYYTFYNVLKTRVPVEDFKKVHAEVEGVDQDPEYRE